MTSKQRAYLKGLASKIQPIFQIGKGGINDNLVQQLDDALEKRELIKVTVLENSMLDPRETCETCARRTDAQPVIAIGSKFVLYRESKKKKVIELPK
ncbi:MAG: ribosome assembly RNA-binding protein YhbY [Clostridia bacterium]|nr:ribosome assembly RNA-binding protein YhbY [Clostridia bacterium]